MNNQINSAADTAPTTAQLLKSTAIAAGAALVILVTVVMPAEYGIDPTGIGKLTGLKRMGEIKASLADEAKAEELAVGTAANAPAKLLPETSVSASPAASAVGIRRDTTTVTLAPDEGREVKVELKQGEIVKFAWQSNAGKANFDVHGDSKVANISYHGYHKGSAASDEGQIKAAFDGSHGWFWRNRSGAPIVITLQTEGPYTSIKLLE
jgi:hypothetical protein